MSRHIETTIELERGTVEIEADYRSAIPGCFYRRNGDPGDPPEPAEVDNLRAYRNGEQIKLTDEEFDLAYQLALEYGFQTEN